MTNNYAIPGRIVVKYGGNALADPVADPVLAELADLSAGGTEVCLVHGGGPAIDVELARRGVVSRRIDGLRVTDDVTLSVTESVLCGTINKQLVRAASSLGVRAVGVSGQDGGVLEAARARPAALGYVGTVKRSNPALLEALLGAGFMPVVAPLAIAADGTSALNVNADLAASAIASSLGAGAIVFVTNVSRVLTDPADQSTAIERMSLAQTRAFLSEPACSDGMKPKVQAALAAAEGGVAAYICKAGPQCVAQALAGEATVIEPNPGGSTWSLNASTLRQISRH